MEQGEQGAKEVERRTSGVSWSAIANHRERKKQSYTEIEKDKNLEAKGGRDNLRNVGNKQAKLRPFNHNFCFWGGWVVGTLKKNLKSKILHNISESSVPISI